MPPGRLFVWDNSTIGMKDILWRSCALAMIWLTYSAWAAGPAKKAPVKKSTVPAKTAGKAAPSKQSATAGARKAPAPAAAARPAAGARSTTAARTSTARKGGAKFAARRPATTWRNRQVVPTPDRYREIQQALAAKGYLSPEEANGAWGQSSADALKKFQAEQNLDATGKINSLSLIALGLGPKREAPVPKPPSEPPQVPEAAK